MDDFRVGVVITVGPGRRENVELVLEHLAKLEGYVPEQVILVLDGPEVERPIWPEWWHGRIHAVRPARKHQPGMEQPRNMGVRALRPELTHVWFLDSDILVAPSTLSAYHAAHQALNDAARAMGGRSRGILIGPYEWLQGQRESVPELHNDWRWEMFREEGMQIKVAKLNVGLGCFGGNLMWPIEEFTRVGGFHPQLHHGRCEDGELGLRAASHRIPMILVPEARGWHLLHDVNTEEAMRRNMRDVPLINQWHPWVEQQGLVVTDQDGARFDFVCSCGAQVNTLELWAHMAGHRGGETASENGVELILPEGM